MKLTHKLILIGAAVLLGTTATGSIVTAAQQKRSTGEITYRNSGSDRSIIDPENPETAVDPGASPQVGKQLTIDFVPELRFGIQDISKEETRYNALAQNYLSTTPARGNHLQVSDFRDKKTGWQLQLKQEYQFRSTTDEQLSLLGAQLFFDKCWSSSPQASPPPLLQTEIIEVKPGISYVVADAEAGSGEGKWAISFGASSQEVENIGNTLIKTELADEKYLNKPVYLNQAVGLAVPYTASMQAATYETVLTWTLSELP